MGRIFLLIKVSLFNNLKCEITRVKKAAQLKRKQIVWLKRKYNYFIE